MSFTVYGEHPGSGGHWQSDRETTAGAVLKAADLISDGWTGVPSAVCPMASVSLPSVPSEQFYTDAGK